MASGKAGFMKAHEFAATTPAAILVNMNVVALRITIVECRQMRAAAVASGAVAHVVNVVPVAAVVPDQHMRSTCLPNGIAPVAAKVNTKLVCRALLGAPLPPCTL